MEGVQKPGLCAEGAGFVPYDFFTTHSIMAQNSDGAGGASKRGGGYTVIAKTFTKRAERITHHATAGDISLSSGKQVQMAGAEGGVRFGKYEPPQQKPHPQIIDAEFRNEADRVITQGPQADFGGITASRHFYGEKVKVKITTHNVPDGTTLQLRLAATPANAIPAAVLAALQWTVEVQGDAAETPFFVLKTSLFNEAAETYTRTGFRTTITSAALTEFFVEGTYDTKPFALPAAGPKRLKPVSYLRNYEELVGLFVYRPAPAPGPTDPCAPPPPRLVRRHQHNPHRLHRRCAPMPVPTSCTSSPPCPP